MVPIRRQQDHQWPRGERTPKILLVVTDLELGGTPLQVYRLAKGLKQFGCRVCVTCLGGYGPVARRIADADIQVEPLGAGDVYDVQVLGRLACLMRSVKPDICHSFLIHANVFTRVVGRSLGVRSIVSTICTAERRYRWHLALENATWRLADRIVCVSGAVRAHMQAHAFIPPTSMRVVYPGIDVDEFLSAGPLPKEQLIGRTDAPLICYLGRLDPLKRVDLIIQALRIVKARGEIYLLIVGDGPTRPSLEKLAAESGLKDHVRFTGFRADVPAVLKSCDLYVTASEQEGWSIAIAEAMAAGIPVVATAVDGAFEQVEEGKTGYLVPPGDIQALAEAISAGIRLPKSRTRTTLTSQRIELSYMREAKEYYDLYQQLLRSRSRS